MGSLQDFKAYLFVKQGSCFATVVHSPLKFAAISAATQLGFVGDRTATREPTPILLPQLKTWQWVKESVFTDGPALIKHYEDDASRIGNLWKGEGVDATSKGEIQVPRPSAYRHTFMATRPNQKGGEGFDATRNS